MTSTKRNPANPEKEKRSPHVRLTPEEVLVNWLNQYYTAPGYLYHLFMALKRHGWAIDIDDPESNDNALTPVQRFCKRWEIGERRFYRAKAKLIEEGRLEETIVGSVTVRLTDSFVISTDDFVSVHDAGVSVHDAGVSVHDAGVSVHDAGVSATPSKALENKGSGDSPDLLRSSQLLSSLSQAESDREREIASAQDPELRQWLIEKAKKLPTPPEFLDQWIESQAEKDSVVQQYKFARGDRSAPNVLGVKLNPSVNEWLTLAQKCGVAIASQSTPAGMVIYLADGSRAPFAEVLEQYPIAALEEMQLAGVN